MRVWQIGTSYCSERQLHGNRSQCWRIERLSHGYHNFARLQQIERRCMARLTGRCCRGIARRRRERRAPMRPRLGSREARRSRCGAKLEAARRRPGADPGQRHRPLRLRCEPLSPLSTRRGDGPRPRRRRQGDRLRAPHRDACDLPRAGGTSLNGQARVRRHSRRRAGVTGHLSNREAGAIARACAHSGLQHLVLAHLSEQCNTPDHALATASAALARSRFRGHVTAAAQDSVRGAFIASRPGGRAVQLALGF